MVQRQSSEDHPSLSDGSSLELYSFCWFRFDIVFVVLWAAVDDGWQTLFVATNLPSVECISINQSINIFYVLGGSWDPTDKKFSSVSSYRQDS